MSVYFLGDSILAGQGVSPHLTAVSLFAQGADTLVQNASHNGDTTRIALERMHYDVLSHEPSTVVVQFGINDCNRWATDNGLPRVRPESFVSNLNEICERARAANAEPVLLTNHRIAGEYELESGVLHYNSLIRWSVRARVIDIARAQPSGADPTLDGVHLSPAGHEFYARLLKEAL